MREPDHDDQAPALDELAGDVDPDEIAAVAEDVDDFTPAELAARWQAIQGEPPPRPRPERRRQRPRAQTIATKAILRRDLRLGALQFPPIDVDVRPRTRGECVDGERPCPWVSCKHHLYLDVKPDLGSIIVNFPDLEFDQLADTCSLDVADRGGETLEVVGELINVTRERVRQIEARALRRLQSVCPSPDAIGAAPMRSLIHRFDRDRKKGLR